MSRVHIEFPAFFSIEGKGQRQVHRAAALLNPELKSQGPTARAAQVGLQSVILKALQKGDIPLLRRFVAIPPGWRPESLRLDLTHRGRRLPIQLAAIYWTSGDMVWLCLPRFPGAILPLPGLVDRYSLPTEAQSALDAFLRRDEAPEVDPEAMAEQSGDRFMAVSLGLGLPGPKVGHPKEALRALLSGGEEESGQDALRAVSRSLNDRHPEGLRLDHVPDERVHNLMAALFGDEPAAIALVGPSGAGRSTLLESALRRALDAHIEAHGARDDSFPSVWHLDPGRVISGQSIIGAWQRRFQSILDTLASPGSHRKRPDVLYVDNPIALCRIGRSSGSRLHLGTVLRPALEARRFPMVMKASPEEWRVLEELDRPLSELFTVIRVDPPSPEQAIRMALSGLAELEEPGAGVVFSDAALRRVVELDRRFPGSKVAPGSLVARLADLAGRGGDTPIDVAKVDALFGQQSGLQARWFQPDSRLDLAELELEIGGRLIGQPAAQRFIRDVLLGIRAGLNRPGRPIASALLVGPTGVGKTETAKVLATLLFSDPSHLIRFDMNEYADGDAVNRLLGDGEREGLLTSRLRARPFAVLLLDEVEKAHPLVLDLLLQLLDEGRLTDALGRTADSRQTIVLMTSNIGAAELAATAGFDRDERGVAAAWRGAVLRSFRPELVNRFDHILPFGLLSPVDLRAVARISVASLLEREGFRRRLVFLDIEEGALDQEVALAAAGTGARALKRALERQLMQPLAAQLAPLPVEQPLRFTVRRKGVGLDALLEPLSFAQPWLEAPPAYTDSPGAVQSRLRALLGPGAEGQVVARSGPPGASMPTLSPMSARVHRLLAAGSGEHGQQAWDAQEEVWYYSEGMQVDDPAEPLLEERLLERLRGRRKALIKHATGYKRHSCRAAPDWTRMMHRGSLRGFLLEATEPVVEDAALAPVDDPVTPEDQVLSLRAAALSETPAPFALRLSCLITEPVGFWHAFAPYLVALCHHAGLCGDEPELYRRGEGGGWEPVDVLSALPGERRLVWESLELPRRFVAEAGIHVLHPPDRSPLALQVSVECSSVGGQLAATEIIRQYIPHGDQVRIFDHRLEAALELHRLDKHWMSAWAWSLGVER